MIKGKIYEGGNSEVYFQHCKDPSSLEYSLDGGRTWTPVPMDMGKINYFEAHFRLKE